MVFEKGEAVNARALWQQRDNSQGILNWTPQFAEISSGNDFGYTSGPWTFRGSATDTIAASGQFTTVWHINQNGQWKFLLDLGVSRVPPHSVEQVKLIHHKKSRKYSKSYLEAEQKFIQSVLADRQATYKKFLSSESILTRHGMMPAENEEEKLKMINMTPPVQLRILGSGASPSNDLAYVYGSVLLDGRTENYLHIWRKEKKQWKLAFEVLRY
jgi:ketosteroid isomerase-like protein